MRPHPHQSGIAVITVLPAINVKLGTECCMKPFKKLSAYIVPHVASPPSQISIYQKPHWSTGYEKKGNPYKLLFNTKH